MLVVSDIISHAKSSSLRDSALSLLVKSDEISLTSRKTIILRDTETGTESSVKSLSDLENI